MVSKHFLCALPYPWKVNNEKKNGRLYRLSIPFWKVRKRKKKQSIEHSGKLLLTVWKFWKRRSLNFFSSSKLIYLSHYCRMRSCLPESHLSKCSGDRYQQYFLRKNQVRITFCFVLFCLNIALQWKGTGEIHLLQVCWFLLVEQVVRLNFILYLKEMKVLHPDTLHNSP